MNTKFRIFLFSFALATMSVQTLASTGLKVYYTALNEILAANVLTDHSRKYFVGDFQSKCGYAYLCKVAVGSKEARLAVSFNMVSRLAKEFGGDCIGLEETTTPINLSGVPIFENGMLKLIDIKIDNLNPQHPFSEYLRAFAANELPKLLQIDLAREIGKVLEKSNKESVCQVKMESLAIPKIVVMTDKIVLTVDSVFEMK